MESRLKIFTIIVGLSFSLSGCAKDLEKLNHDLAELNQAMAGKGGAQARAGSSGRAQTGGVAMATQPEAGQSKPTQIIVPNDKQVAAAIDEALPTIKKILAIHQCVKDNDSLRQMNIYAVPGVNMTQMDDPRGSFPNYVGIYGGLKYHDQNKCISVTTIDEWIMPALNALQFRTVYFADDSGETVNFHYLFKKMDDGSWKIAMFHRK